MRNWNYINKNDDKNSQNQELWFEIPREYKKNDIIFKAHTTGGSHIAVERTLEEIVKLGYRWEGIEKDVTEFFLKWEVWQGRTKNPQNRLIINHFIETTHPRERYQMDLVQWSDYLWESEEKELLNEELEVEKAEREISNDEIKSIFKDKKKGKKYKKKQEKKEIWQKTFIEIVKSKLYISLYFIEKIQLLNILIKNLIHCSYTYKKCPYDIRKVPVRYKESARTV